MALTQEWRNRIDQWRAVLPQLLYRKLATVELDGFVTAEQLTPEQALERDFRPMPVGTKWGGQWEYGWFRAHLVLPAKAAGERIVFRLGAGWPEAVIFVDGRVASGHGCGRDHFTLARAAEAGRQYQVLAEVYAGHGRITVGEGPVPHGVETVPDCPLAQAEVGEASFGVWQEAVYQLGVDVETLLQVRDGIDPESLRVAEIDAALRDFTVIFDPELPPAEMLATAEAARQRLAGVLACVNGSTAPVMYAFGHGHLDVAWLWPLAETERKIARTFANQLALLDEYPDYRFLQSEPHLFGMLRRRYPELYERVRREVADGRVICEGGMWVEPDTNVAGGEALIRQFLHGKRFFREEFGIDNELLWLPDVFGYSGALPQIMRGCGVRYFATAKIFWTYNGGEDFPHNTFVWEGIDGSEVYVHLCNDYNSHTMPREVIRRWTERVQKGGFSTRLMPFGHGDGGGGPTRDHLEFARRLADLEGVPKVKMAGPLEYFRDQERRGWPNVRYVGELYFQAHRGTYTSQAQTKKGNRRSELALREAELWACAARALAGFQVPAENLDEAWKNVLLNQFHDVLPGSSIRRVYEDAAALHAEAMATAGATAAAAAAAICRQDPASLTVFNSLNWERTALVALPDGAGAAVGDADEPLEAQTVDGRTSVEVTVPSCGWTTLKLAEADAAGTEARVEPAGAVRATDRCLENDRLRVELNDAGEIVSLFDKRADRELAAGTCNRMRMYKDVPSCWDAWDLESMYPRTPVELNGAAAIEVVSGGPLAAAVRVRRTLHESEMTQTIRLRRGSRRVDFETAIDWRERHKLLKVDFPVTVHAHEAIHEIQFGHIRRPNHASRPFDADRFEVCNHKWSALAEEARGCAVLNDCKYGLNVAGSTISLTLLKSALAPDMHADRGVQEFTYAFYAWNGPLADSGVVREAYELNCPLTTAPGAGGRRSLLATGAANIVVEAVKPAEDGSGDVVVRLYEAKRTATRCELTTTLPVASAEQTDMLEGPGRPLPVTDGRIRLEFRPFEIKTVRLRLA